MKKIPNIDNMTKNIPNPSAVLVGVSVVDPGTLVVVVEVTVLMVVLVTVVVNGGAELCTVGSVPATNSCMLVKSSRSGSLAALSGG